MEATASNNNTETAANVSPTTNDTIDNSVDTGTAATAITADVSAGTSSVLSDLADNSYMSAVGTANVSGSDPHATITSTADEVTFVIDHAKKQELEVKFHDLINNPRYWENANRIKRLDEALVLPVYDDRSMQQFFISAEDELLAAEMKAAIKEHRPPVMPTQEQIMELAEYKYHDKYVLEPQRKAEREAKKKSKAA